ncbi:hypothetical protein KORDIASMS9_01699 [Kordia sp. SMS9]|uniref:hypothetical protein n=1 Tax=Kordia sp. SMS9 TaxID=2282170 RepID=UPI000E104E78|nr:hypothetical protein [Kordia sp. SMS9]AXG69476.1 hypothetical protein KORDIASMS9_01699 [Kordia sp. SMS9]
MRKTKKKELKLKKLSIATVSNLAEIKGMSGARTLNNCGLPTKTNPPDMCMYTLEGC